MFRPSHRRTRSLVTNVVLLLTAVCALEAATPLTLPNEEMKARDFLRNLLADRLEAASKDFSADMRRHVGRSLMTDMRRETAARFGQYRHIILAKTKDEKGFHMMELTTEFERGDMNIDVVFDSHDQIGAVFFNPIPTEVVDPILDRAARAWLDDFEAGRYAEMRKNFSPALLAQMSAEKLAGLHRDVTMAYGAFRSVTSVKQTTNLKYRVIELVADFELMPARVRLVFDGTKVSGLGITKVRHLDPASDPDAAESSTPQTPQQP